MPVNVSAVRISVFMNLDLVFRREDPPAHSKTFSLGRHAPRCQSTLIFHAKNPRLSEARAVRNCRVLQTAIFPSITLAEFYRFALLLTGRSPAAESVMAETLSEVETHLDQIRSEANRQAWLAQRIRERCLKNNLENPVPVVPRLLREELAPGAMPEVLGIEAYILAEHFHCLPEPGRSALALFYLDLFTPEDIGKLLKMNLEELGAALAESRGALQDSLRGATGHAS